MMTLPAFCAILGVSHIVMIWVFFKTFGGFLDKYKRDYKNLEEKMSDLIGEKGDVDQQSLEKVCRKVDYLLEAVQRFNSEKTENKESPSPSTSPKKSRSEEQRRLASIRKKEWWEKKKSQEGQSTLPGSKKTKRQQPQLPQVV